MEERESYIGNGLEGIVIEKIGDKNSEPDIVARISCDQIDCVEGYQVRLMLVKERDYL